MPKVSLNPPYRAPNALGMCKRPYKTNFEGRMTSFGVDPRTVRVLYQSEDP